MTDVAVVIPARGGSKGIAAKNLRHIGGLPLVARAVRAGLSAKSVSRVFVSTDDAAIADVALAHGGEVIWRPGEISGDTASSESALLHALDHLYETEGYRPAVLAFLQCTSPFIRAEDIDGAVQPILDGEADSVFAAAPFHYFIWKRDGQGKAISINHSGLRQRRQDREPEFLEAGSVYAMGVESFREEKNRFCGRQSFHVVDARRLMEIDDPDDLARAQALAPLFDREDLAAALPPILSAIVFDFDGVFTDNLVLLNESGIEAVTCSRSDGMGLENLRKRKVPMLVLSKEKNLVVAMRCQKLGLNCIQGIDDKPAILEAWLKANDHDRAGLIYMGNDLNDLGCMTLAACAVGPADSHPDIVPVLQIRLNSAGGRGAIRELSDMVCKSLDDGNLTLST